MSESTKFSREMFLKERLICLQILPTTTRTFQHCVQRVRVILREYMSVLPAGVLSKAL